MYCLILGEVINGGCDHDKCLQRHWDQLEGRYI